jgi:hypothetical protein
VRPGPKPFGYSQKAIFGVLFEAFLRPFSGNIGNSTTIVELFFSRVISRSYLFSKILLKIPDKNTPANLAETVRLLGGSRSVTREVSVEHADDTAHRDALGRLASRIRTRARRWPT